MSELLRVPPSTAEKIRRLRRAGFAVWATARDCGVSVETVRAVLRRPAKPGRRRQLVRAAARLRAEGADEAAIVACFGGVVSGE